MVRRRISAVVSGHSRHHAEFIALRFRAALGGTDDFTLHIVASSGQATETAREAARHADVVVAVGGDGTVADVATGIFGTSAALGIVPAGSTNIVAKSLGIPRDPAKAIAVLSGPYAIRPIDVGRSGDRIFLHLAGAGFDAELFLAADPSWKRRVGWLAYIPAAFAALRLAPSDVRITVDNAVIEERSALVLVANGGSVIVPGFRLHPEIAVDDGWLDVLVFSAITPIQIAETLSHAGLRRLDQSPHVTWRRGRSMRVEASPPLPVQLDGDPRGSTPREFHIVPAGVSVVTPAPVDEPSGG